MSVRSTYDVWQVRAACRGPGARLFFPPAYQERKDEREERERRAKAICASCAVQPDCLDWSTVKSADLQADPELSRLMPAVRFMHAEYSRGPTLTEIAQQVKLSPFHFHRRFTELLGMTPKQYMLACQINQAKKELLAGEKGLATIAKDCGFAHQSHFTSRFKQATGLTPTRWRKVGTDFKSSEKK